jgi:hypothetical protein
MHTTHIPHPVNYESSAFFLMAFGRRRGHHHRRIEVPKSHQAANMPRGSEPCLAYRPRSRCTPSIICPLSTRMLTNWAWSASSITTSPQRWTWTRAPSCWVSWWIRSVAVARSTA